MDASKNCSNNILESFFLAGVKKNLQWNTWTKNYHCANFQDIWTSSKSRKLGIKYAISAGNCIFGINFLQKKSYFCWSFFFLYFSTLLWEFFGMYDPTLQKYKIATKKRQLHETNILEKK